MEAQTPLVGSMLLMDNRVTKKLRCGFQSPSPLDTAATRARSCSRTVETLNVRADAAIRVRAAPKAIAGLVSPFFAR